LGAASPDARTDTQLVAAMNRGDESAFRALYDRYRDWVANLAQRFTGDRELALDVVQETFTYLRRQFPGFELRAKLTTFLYPVVKHLAQQLRRKGRREHTADADQGGADPPAPNDPASSETAPGLALERDDTLAALVAALPAAQREPLLMRFVDDMSQAEIAEALELPTGTVKSRLHNALRRLRDDPRTASLLLD
jgi:RNA polymerase sigma-70 factor (ECF subfamily)